MSLGARAIPCTKSASDKGTHEMAKTPPALTAAQTRAAEVFMRLVARYPGAQCSLDHRDPLQLLVATILAAQCTDARVNQVTPALFRKYLTPEDYVRAPEGALEEVIRRCGFYRMKAKNIRGACATILERFGGKVPQTMDELLQLDGVGRKTANVLLGACFNTPGVVVDTHCMRITRRLGFTKSKDPKKIELDLMKIWPQEKWSLWSHLTVFHGRDLCTARAPQCSQCPVRELCPFPETKEGKRIGK